MGQAKHRVGGWEGISLRRRQRGREFIEFQKKASNIKKFAKKETTRRTRGLEGLKFSVRGIRQSRSNANRDS